MPPAEGGGQAVARDGAAGSPPTPAGPTRPRGDRERLQAFLAQLARMGSQERLRASRYEFDSWQLHAWAAHYPEEVPLVNGEFEFIALRLVDLE